MKEFIELLQNWRDPYINNTLGQYSTVFLIIFLAVVIRFIICSIVYHRLANWIGKKREDIDLAVLIRIKRPLGYIIVLSGIYIAIQILSIPDESGKIQVFVNATFTTLISFSAAWMLLRLVDILMLYMKTRAEKTESKLDDQLVPLISRSLKIFIFLIAFAVIVQNLGYSISGVLAGLGIGGLALALAAKDTLSNLFGSITIFTDNPFQVGDIVKIGGQDGVVEKVGFRSTRIRTFHKTEISIPNSTVANATIDNYSRMQRRRVSDTLGFTYDTNHHQMKEIVAVLKKILKKTKGVHQDFFYVGFTGFGDSALEVMLLYYTDTTAWQEYMDIRETVNLKIMAEMEKLGAEFAFNTMSLYLHSGDKIPVQGISNSKSNETVPVKETKKKRRGRPPKKESNETTTAKKESAPKETKKKRRGRPPKKK